AQRFRSHRVGETVAESRRVTTAYGRRDRVQEVTAPDGTVTRYLYDALGRNSELIEAAGAPEERRSTMAYDAADNLLSRTTGLAGGYNSEGVGLFALQQATDYQYDALNRRTRVTEAAHLSDAQALAVLGHP